MMLRAGYAQTDVTPDGGQDLSGFAMRKGRTVGVSDHLLTRSICLDVGGTRAVLSATDILGFSRTFAAAARRRIVDETEIPPSNINLASTHTHSGPAAAPLKYCGRLDPSYVATLQDRVCDTALRSAARGKTVVLEVARTTCAENMNRRIKGGPVDREVLVACLREADSGKPLVLICNYACHPVVLGESNLHVSADYPGFLARFIKQRIGAACLFLNGACGDVNPKVAHRVDPAEAQLVGERLGDRIIDSLDQATEISEIPLACHSMNALLPIFQPRSASELERHRQLAVEKFRLDPSWFEDHVSALVRQIRGGTYPKTTVAPMSLVSFGPELGILFVPGELFTEIGMELKKQAPFRHLMVCAYANGVLGYIPTRETFKLGGYEPYVASFFYGKPAFGPGVEEAVLEAGKKLFAKVRT